LKDADVIVIGGGGSGFSAAIVAAQEGRRVILLEKNEVAGGSTALSVGSFSAADTSLQRRAGVADTAEEFLEDMRVANGPLEEHENQALRRVLVDGASTAFEWLRSLGVEFFGPTPEPPFTHPRMHNVVPSSRAYIRALHGEALRRGVDVRVSSRVQRLDTDRAGNVVGVDVGHPLRASAVVLATGDYSGSSGLKQRWVSEQTAKIPAINLTSTGDGFEMALGIGAEVRNAWRVEEAFRFMPPKGRDLLRLLPVGRLASRSMRLAIDKLPRRALAAFARHALTSWVAPSSNLYASGAILINSRGERFANELDQPARSIANEEKNLCYIVFDSTVAEMFEAWPNYVSTFPGIAYAYLRDYATLRSDVFHRSSTLEGLAQSLQVDGDQLRRTVADFNEAVAHGRDAVFGRAVFAEPLQRPPYFALGPMTSRVAVTNGGLIVDTSCRVLRDGSPIGGLYAAGSTGQGGLILKNHGLHIAWAVTSGRLAGLSAAADVEA
jgi:fumarate reductase flavoprotein subunit